MDSRIKNLKSTTFCGTRLTRRRIADIQKTVELFPALSRHELAATLCSHPGWFTPKGRDRLGSCLRMLEQLEARGIVSLPAKRRDREREPAVGDRGIRAARIRVPR